MQPQNLSTDEAVLIESLKANNTKAFNFLFTKYRKSLLGSIDLLVNDADAAQDLLQESFIKIWKKIHHYNPSKGRLFTWMLQICRNTALDYMRKMSRNQTVSMFDEDLNLDCIPEPMTELNTEAFDLEAALILLNKNRYAAIDSVYVKGYSHHEAADVLKIPVGTLKSRIRSGLLVMRAHPQFQKEVHPSLAQSGTHLRVSATCGARLKQAA